MSIKWIVILLSFAYLLLLFVIAGWAEKHAHRKWLNGPNIYALSLAVYCTAWTYYGSVGRAANEGIDFLTTYIGPILITPLFWLILRKIIRISKAQRLTTIADFISARYGKSVSLGVLVTIISVLAIIPYMSIQLKAISQSFDVFTGDVDKSRIFFNDTAFYITMLLGLFTFLFGIRNVDTSRKNVGLIAAIAFESVFKLFAFILLGGYVTFFLFDGFGDLFEAAKTLPNYDQLTTLEASSGYSNWFWLNLLSMLAIILLPRQFHVGVKENRDENHLKRAMWLFPLYLLLVNIFVIPVALGGNLIFSDQSVNADTYVLAIPLAFDNQMLAYLVYLGGFSAATSMVIVSVSALSIMLGNNIIMPSVLKSSFLGNKFKNQLDTVAKSGRYFMIFVILLLAYLYFKLIGERFSLVSIGQVSFVGVAQFAPAILGGIFWKKGNRNGAVTGLLVGFTVWFFILVVPTTVVAQLLPEYLVNEGIFGLSWLTPYNFLGLKSENFIVNGFMWSLLFNTIAYVIISLFTQPSTKEINQAEVFVDVFKYSAVYESAIFWKGKALVQDIKNLLIKFLGKERIDRAFQNFHQRNAIEESSMEADFRVVNFAEKLLAGAVGSASARVMISSVVKEEKINLNEVFSILQETQKYISDNKILKQKSAELEDASARLRNANEELQRLDKLKDEFVSTVTHEMRTPITSIRALSEILKDNEDLEPDDRNKFFSTIVAETKRMDRLINQVLDLEKMESGKLQISLTSLHINDVITGALQGIEPVILEKNIKLIKSLDTNLPVVRGNEDRLKQVVLNLLSNAIKFCDPYVGEIKVITRQKNKEVIVEVIDNGPGVAEESKELIFEAFYQAQGQTLKKPEGSGLGLTICHKIIELHNGKIWHKNAKEGGAVVSFSLPKLRMEK